MLIQPLIENSIKHAQLHLVEKPEISLSVKKQNQILLVSLKDNGKGRTVTVNKIHQSKAISILQKRIDEINLKMNNKVENAFEITDLKNENNLPIGTECIIRLPYYEMV